MNSFEQYRVMRWLKLRRDCDATVVTVVIRHWSPSREWYCDCQRGTFRETT